MWDVSRLYFLISKDDQFCCVFCLVGHCSFTESLCLVIVPSGLIDGDLRVWVVSRLYFLIFKDVGIREDSLFVRQRFIREQIRPSFIRRCEREKLSYRQSDSKEHLSPVRLPKQDH